MLVIKTDQEKFDRGDIERCAEALRGGAIGVIPTDTVYGIAALASDAGAVERVMRIKERAPDKPLPVQVASVRDANLLGVADGPAAVALIERFWPGPLTLVMERRPVVELPCQPGGTIGIRIPASPFCLALIKEAGYLVAPSANPRGAPAPQAADGLAQEIRDAVDFVVDAGSCPGGVESTVVDISAGVEVLREGAIPSDAINKALEDALGERGR